MAAADIVGWTATQNNKAKAAAQISTTSLFFRVICQIPPFENAIYFIIGRNPSEESKSTPTHIMTLHITDHLCVSWLLFFWAQNTRKNSGTQKAGTQRYEDLPPRVECWCLVIQSNSLKIYWSYLGQCVIKYKAPKRNVMINKLVIFLILSFYMLDNYLSA